LNEYNRNKESNAGLAIPSHALNIPFYANSQKWQLGKMTFLCPTMLTAIAHWRTALGLSEEHVQLLEALNAQYVGDSSPHFS
jgi:hypothetical protein